MNGPYENFRIMVFGCHGPKAQYQFQQSPTKSHRHITSLLFQITVLIYQRFSVETVKLNFHLEQEITLIDN